MKPGPSVSQSVRPSVTQGSHTSHHLIFLIFCIKLAYERFKMAKNGQNWAQNEVFALFLEIASLDFANYANNDRQA